MTFENVKASEETRNDLFSSAAPAELRRAKAWLEAQFRRADKDGGFTQDDVALTPVMAEVIKQQHNTHNRRLRGKRVERMAATIRAGRWVDGVARLMFSTERTLLNGQHTCDSVIASGRSVTVDMRFGLPAKAWDAIDTGIVRGGEDALREFPNASRLSGTARLVYLIEEGAAFSKSAIENDVIHEFVTDNPDIHDAVSAGYKLYGKFRVKGAGPCAAYYLIRRYSKAPIETIDDFFRLTATGLNLKSRRDPIYVLRDYLQASGKGRRAIDVTAAIIIAWNYHAIGKRVSSVEPVAEQFPEVSKWQR